MRWGKNNKIFWKQKRYLSLKEKLENSFLLRVYSLYFTELGEGIFRKEKYFFFVLKDKKKFSLLGRVYFLVR